MSGAYIPLARRLFPNAKIVLDRFHIIQHLGRAFLKTRIAIMNQFDKKSLPYRALKKDVYKRQEQVLQTLLVNRLQKLLAVPSLKPLVVPYLKRLDKPWALQVVLT